MQAIKQRYLDDQSQTIYTVFPFEQVRAAIGSHDTRTWIWLALAAWMETHECDLA